MSVHSWERVPKWRAYAGARAGMEGEWQLSRLADLSLIHTNGKWRYGPMKLAIAMA